MTDRRTEARRLRDQGMALQAIGEALGVTKERARQLLLPPVIRHCVTCGQVIADRHDKYCRSPCLPIAMRPRVPGARGRGRPRNDEAYLCRPPVVLNRAERAARRERMARAVHDGASVHEVAEREGVTPQTVRVAHRQIKIRK